MPVQAALAAALALVAWPQVVRSTCDICSVRYEHIKDFSTPFEEGKQYPTCNYYKDAACCSQKTVQDIANGYSIYDDEEYKSNINACNTDDPTVPKVSAVCKGFLEAEYCFYECDVNIAKYRKHADCEYNATKGESDKGWEIYKMPIKSQYCDDWFEACQNDFYCFNSTSGDSDWLTQSRMHKQGLCTKASGNCGTFADVFGAAANTTTGGKGMCEGLWGDSFIYAENGTDGYVMNFTGPNPNDDLHPTVAPQAPCPDHDVTEQQLLQACPASEHFAEVETTPCELCHLRNDQTADVAIANPELQGRCAKYSQNACCSAETALAIDASKELYDSEFRWNKCYEYHEDIAAARDASPKLKAAYERCDAWFREEECLYECDANAGKWRKHEDCKDESGGSNAWQIEGMPIKASECDAFYAACKDLVMCTCSGPDCPPDAAPKSLFGFAIAGDAYCKNETTYCQKTVKDVWTDAKEWCEKLWDNAFVYERHEAKAYSFAWNASGVEVADWSPQTHMDNPNNLVYTDKPWPPECAEQAGTVDMCGQDGSMVAATPAPASAAGGATPEQQATGSNTSVTPEASASTGVPEVSSLGLAALAPLLAVWWAL